MAEKEFTPFTVWAADQLAFEVSMLVKAGKLDSRCLAADALLEYALNRFGSNDPINDLVKKVEEERSRPDTS